MYLRKEIPKCYNCIYFRRSELKYEIGNCIKYLGSHHKPVSVEIARNHYMMCGYYGTQHVSGDLIIVKKDDFIMQPHI